MTGEDLGYRQLISVTKMRHLDDVRRCQFSVTTEPRNLQIWTHSVTQNQAHLPDLWKKLCVSKEKPSKNMGIKPTINLSRTPRATFSGDPALELGPVFLKDKNIHHGGNEDRRRDPRHRFNHLGHWKAIAMTTKIKKYKTFSIKLHLRHSRKGKSCRFRKTTRESWQRESKGTSQKNYRTTFIHFPAGTACCGPTKRHLTGVEKEQSETGHTR